MPLLDVAEFAPDQRPFTVAQSDTGQSRTVASFLIAWWNAQTCDGFNLAGRWTEQRKGPRAPARGQAAEGVDQAIARDPAATVAMVAAHREDPITCRRLALAQGDSHG